ncbi:MAG: hypothetical protein ACFFCE_16440 [Promethearchaeota archaeon]
MITNEDEINKKIKLTSKILSNVHEILELFKPLLIKMINMPEAEDYKKNGNFLRAASLFSKISDLCEEIETISFCSVDFLKSLGN